MQRPRVFLIYWLPILLWMASIYGASADAASNLHSSRIIGPLLHWLYPGVSARTEDIVVTFVRKCAHVTEYGLFALLVLRALRQPLPPRSGIWSWNHFAEALWLSLFYASTDEFHQTFVPYREGCIRDVMIDGFGATMGLLLVFALGRWRKIW